MSEYRRVLIPIDRARRLEERVMLKHMGSTMKVLLLAGGFLGGLWLLQMVVQK